MINTFIFEFTDNYINIYNKKTGELLNVAINSNIIVDNKIYDYLKLVNLLNEIVNKYKIINSIFKTKIIILNFEEVFPSEMFLRKNLFKKIINVNAKIINAYEILDDRHIFISGNVSYYKGKVVDKLNKKCYIVVGDSSTKDKIKNSLIKKYKIKLLEYENSNTILYESIK